VTSGSSSLDARIAELQERSSRRVTNTKRRTEAVLAAQSQVRAVTATASNADGSVRATVDAGGMLTKLFASPGVAANVIVEVVQRAAADARAQVKAICDPLRQEGLLRDPAIDPPGPAPVQAPPPPRVRRDVPEQEEVRGPFLREDPW